MLIIQLYQIYVSGCCQGGHCSGRCTCYNEGCVNLSVLHRLHAVAEGLIGRFDIINRQVVCAQTIQGVKVNTGAGVTDRYGFTL